MRPRPASASPHTERGASAVTIVSLLTFSAEAR